MITIIMKFTTVLPILILVNQLYSLQITKWTLINQSGKIKISNISSPIDIYSALYERSLIDWPIKSYNDVKYRWISHENWTFVSYPFSIEQSQSFSLFVSGLDINPLIFLNDRYIGTTFSEFVSRDFPLNTSILKSTDNILRLLFYSPLLIANVSAENSRYRVPPDCWPDEYHGECHINFIRKTQASFGWDWGPAIPTVGIRGNVELLRTNEILSKIRNIKLLTKANANCSQWSAKVELNVFALLVKSKYKLCVTVEIPDLYSNQTQCMEIIESGLVKFTVDLPINQQLLKLWWPYEMGTPALYLLNAFVFYFDKILDSSSQYVGFRYVTLNQTKLSNNKGRIFEFYVNCKSFFLKGTNWVPRTYMTLGWNNKSHIEFLLNSIKIANMNSIRLWGGGKPEHEHFYNVADRLGLMIWHDLMFACSLYPNDKIFNDVIYNEVSEIVSNIQIHPSILVWSGNNEIEVLIAQGWYNTTKMDFQNINRYYNLFGKIIKNAVKNVDPITPYILSSPSNGIESEKTKGVSSDPQSPYFGDVHFYIYDGDLWDEKLYPITRMTTEFGFQSLPTVGTWKTITFSDDDFQINGKLMEHVQHHPDGNQQLLNAIIYYFGKLFPDRVTEASEQYRWFSYLTQINQANILKVHINKLRSSECLLTPDGIGLTRGIMYWQLNDNWIAPTWSSIDYFGFWKLAHYSVQKSFSTTRINIGIIDKSVSITLILSKDKLVETQYKIIIICRNISKNITSSITGKKSLKIDSSKFNCNVNVVMVMNINEFLKELKCPDEKHCLFQVNLERNNSVVSNDFLIIAKPIDLSIPFSVARDKIALEIFDNDPSYNTCSIILRNNYIHLYVMLTTTTLGNFSENGIHLTSNETKIIFEPWNYNSNEIFNCSTLHVEVISLNGLFF